MHPPCGHAFVNLIYGDKWKLFWREMFDRGPALFGKSEFNSTLNPNQ